MTSAITTEMDPDEMSALAIAKERGPLDLNLYRRRDIIRLLKFFADDEIRVSALCDELGRYTRSEIDAARADFRDMGASYWTQDNIKKW